MLTKSSMLILKRSKVIFNNRFLSTSPQIKTEFANGIKEIVMCNSQARNALSIEMMENLIYHLTSDQQNKELRVIVISGEGPAFSAGHNLKELVSDQSKQQKCFQLASELMNKILDCPVPVIAKVDGIAAAAGCQLVAQCDMAIASKRSVFSTPGANFGIFCSTPGVALARSIPKTSALYMLFTGFPVSAEEAFRIGLITKVCSEEKLNEELENICNAIKAKSRDIVELGKTFYYQQIHYNVKKAYELGGEKMQENLQLPDCKEGIQSFIEKRKPRWGSK
ncbi:enoyl-CoA hydratase domain-containing protein 3, mitochondrial isoform X1 [Euwallacea similis]|uniref:enoyl-CoA hydratase domain-containing protein 3, mitochondrial isoform X1 n=3 Tax=Euwallacea similis TaxID=1736056 RepID=UPI003450D422